MPTLVSTGIVTVPPGTSSFQATPPVGLSHVAVVIDTSTWPGAGATQLTLSLKISYDGGVTTPDGGMSAHGRSPGLRPSGIEARLPDGRVTDANTRLFLDADNLSGQNLTSSFTMTVD